MNEPTQVKKTKTVALGISGGIAAYKAAEVLRGLQRAGCTVRVAMTKRATEFIQPLTFRALSGAHVIVDDYDPTNPDPIAHITFSQTIDLLVIAPATANLIAKLANGIADDFITSTYLASTAPVLIAPAMNTTMWHHPTTRRNVARLKEDGVHFVEPDAGEMACGTIGPGRLSEPDRIVTAALALLSSSGVQSDLSGERILITAGATREAIDPVRFISNRSSGKMGFALASAALERGAEVTVVAGVVSVPCPSQAEVLSVTSAEEMHNAVMERIGDATIFIGAAAVADYRPVDEFSEKLKKSEASISLKLERTRDILQEVASKRRPGQLIIGFAAETNDVVRNANEKLVKKDLDAIVANDVSRADSGFDRAHNAVTILTRHGSAVEIPLLPKIDVAHRILDEIKALRSATLKVNEKAQVS